MTELKLHNQFSVIVPLAPREITWKSLILDLVMLGPESEIVLVSQEELPQSELKEAQAKVMAQLVNVVSKPGRAEQMNTGAEHAKNEWLWFLHADSKLPRLSIKKLLESTTDAPNSLHYFDLRFLKDGPGLMKVNSWGANFRSKYLKIPFGDQGFCLKKELFVKLGGFDTKAQYGEDHLFVWSAHKMGVPLKAVGAPLFTSARKYQKSGWAPTTLKHIYCTFKQATPECLKLIKERVVR